MAMFPFADTVGDDVAQPGSQFGAIARVLLFTTADEAENEPKDDQDCEPAGERHAASFSSAISMVGS